VDLKLWGVIPVFVAFAFVLIIPNTILHSYNIRVQKILSHHLDLEPMQMHQQCGSHWRLSSIIIFVYDHGDRIPRHCVIGSEFHKKLYDESLKSFEGVLELAKGHSPNNHLT
jgi:hypothetical protein